MKADVELQSDGKEIDMNNICPFMSNFETGCGDFIGTVRCIGCKCKCWNENTRDCGMKFVKSASDEGDKE